MLTSANAARHGGAGLVRLAELPVYAVGAATAAAARAAGLDVTHVGAGNADDLVGAMAAAGVRLPLHLAGADHKAVTRYGMTITRRIVYRSAAVTALPEAARSALADGRVALIHSPRAAAMLAALVTSGRDAIRSAAISPAAAAALGPGWGAVTIAAQPDDDALLAAAALLCEGLADRSGAPA